MAEGPPWSQQGLSRSQDRARLCRKLSPQGWNGKKPPGPIGAVLPQAGRSGEPGGRTLFTFDTLFAVVAVIIVPLQEPQTRVCGSVHLEPQLYVIILQVDLLARVTRVLEPGSRPL
jgi:hypothetical protein